MLFRSDGTVVGTKRGSENNDEFVINSSQKPEKRTNHAGGILGGISDGSPIILRAHIKPTASIASTQHTIDKDGNPIEINIKGRHDPVIVPRAVVVVESMVAVTLLDLMLSNMSARTEAIVAFYRSRM